MGPREALRRLDWPLLLTAAALMGLGLLFIDSASFDAATGESRDFAGSQLNGIAIAFGVLVLLIAVPYLKLARFAPLLYVAALGLLAATAVSGITKNAAKRWIQLGPVVLQPSEFMKPVLVLTLAQLLRHRPDLRTFRGLLLPLALVALPALLIASQPDLGTAILLFPGALAILYSAGARRKPIVAFFALALVAGGLLVAYGLKPYQRERLWTFLSPSTADKDAAGYQVDISKVMIGSGGFAGAGVYEGPLNTLGFMPERHSDFIVAVIGEEWGFLGCAFLISLLALFTGLGYAVALRVREPCGKLLAVGMTTAFSCQMIVNVAMVVGLLPNKGVPLPFVSHGRSSLLASAIGLALVLNVALRRVPVIAVDDFEHR